VFELQASGACYSWRLPPPRRLDGGLLGSPQGDCAVLQRSDCERYCAHPAGAVKSNSSKARREGQQVVWPGQVLELVVNTPHESDLRVTTSKRTARQPWSLSQWGLAWWQPSEFGIKIIMSTLLSRWFAILQHKLVFTLTYIVFV
jgi:hypothetical protein